MRALGMLLGLVCPGIASGGFNDFDLEPASYYDREHSDPMTKVIAAQGGDFGTERGKGLLVRLLEELKVPVESQVMVFTKTSLQRGVVWPENPRAMYFNEEVYVGWAPGGRIEVGSVDPKAGMIFTIENEVSREKTVKFESHPQCIQCHAGSATNFIPGPLARSVHPDSKGRVRGTVRSFDLVSHKVPVDERWGGWWVTGAGKQFPHRGNRTVGNGKREISSRGAPVLDDLSGILDDAGQFPVTGSNVATLMVFDHQLGVHQQITESHYKVRYEAWAVDEENDWETKIPEEAMEVAEEEREKLVKMLLMVDEAAFPGDQVTEDEGYMKAFREGRKVDSKGRSLKDFAIEDNRLFKWRCSYMIYSGAFQGLPGVFKEMVYARLAEVLGAVQPVEGYEHLSRGERAVILGILRETIPGF